jgi:cell wall assembly regulator SMI1
VQKAWKEIEKYIEAREPNRFDGLRPPAAAAAIQQLERVLDATLPDEVHQSLRMHDGMEEGRCSTSGACSQLMSSVKTGRR